MKLLALLALIGLSFSVHANEATDAATIEVAPEAMTQETDDSVIKHKKETVEEVQLNDDAQTPEAIESEESIEN